MVAVIVSVEGFVSIDTCPLFIYQKSVSSLKLVCVSSHASIAFRAHSPVSPRLVRTECDIDSADLVQNRDVYSSDNKRNN